MLLRQRQLQAKIQMFVDAALFCFAFWLTHYLRNLPSLDPRHEIQDFSYYAWLLPVILILTPFFLEIHGFYQRPVLGSRSQTAWALFRASAWMTLGIIVLLSLIKMEGARGVVFLFGPIGFLLVFLKEELVRRWATSASSGPKGRKRVILVGDDEDTNRLASELRSVATGEVQVTARLDINTTPTEQLAEMLHEHSANAVIISPRQTRFGEIEKAIRACEIEGVEVWLHANFFQTAISQTRVDELYGHPMLVFRTAPEASWQAVAKTALDLVGGFVLLVLLTIIPVLPLAALLVKLTSPGPVFFRQKRAGLNGAPFTMFKFRTMATNAEQLKQELMALNEMSGPVFKVTNDPRVTSVGRFLRKWSIDEFPQLINVLRGEMSLVGPRPLPVDEVRRFDDLAHRRRLSVKPGLTCLWQVSGRNNVSDFKEWVRLDLEYIDNWSLWLDFKILWRTIPVVLLAKGAK
jgi:exopolysaccharide biosynthesis polyprenyl glycosylphosphotransferase